MNTRIESDLDTIIAAALVQRIGNMAASVRAAQSEVESYGYESGELYDYRRPDHILTANGLHRVAAPCRTLEAAPPSRKPLWQRRWVWVTTGLALAIIILGVITDLAAAALGVTPATLIIISAAVVVVALMVSGGSRSGGGKRFSGTFEGRFH